MFEIYMPLALQTFVVLYRHPFASRFQHLVTKDGFCQEGISQLWSLWVWLPWSGRATSALWGLTGQDRKADCPLDFHPVGKGFGMVFRDGQSL